jgi:sulfatase modifying factor 1
MLGDFTDCRISPKFLKDQFIVFAKIIDLSIVVALFIWYALILIKFLAGFFAFDTTTIRITSTEMGGSMEKKKALVVLTVSIVFFMSLSMVHQVKRAHALSPTYTDPATGMEFVLVKGGCFEMGDIFGDGYKNEKPVHQVCVDDFFMGKLLVTQKQWRAIMGNDPSFFKSCGENCPVEQVSSGDVQDYIRTLNQRSGKNFRLPSEAEWEFAARSGGKKEKWAGTSDQAELGAYAWYSANSGSETHPVGLKKPNGLGLFDMTGNVWEWASDWYDEEYYANGPKDNPRGPTHGSLRVGRGGGWRGEPRLARCSGRGSLDPDSRSRNIGFRLVLTP